MPRVRRITCVSQHRLPAATKPHCVSGRPKAVCSAATIRSQASAISVPPAQATPVNAEIQGFCRGWFTKSGKSPLVGSSRQLRPLQ